jgi:hypothetical protein
MYLEKLPQAEIYDPRPSIDRQSYKSLRAFLTFCLRELTVQVRDYTAETPAIIVF